MNRIKENIKEGKIYGFIFEDNKENEIIIDKIPKVLREKYIDEELILIKHECKLLNLNIGEKYDLIIDKILEKIGKKTDVHNISRNFENADSYEELYSYTIVRQLRTYNSKDSDYITVLSNNVTDKTEKRVNNLIKREELECLNNTIFKSNKDIDLNPINTFNINIDKINDNIFEELSKSILEQIKNRK